MNNIPLSLYIHIPWCERKCPYCDFNSHTARTPVDEALYIDTLLQDLDLDISKFGQTITGRTVQTVFIGGGTPSLFTPQSFRRLFNGLRNRLQFDDHAEITLEANPGSSEAEKFAGFRQAGINRLSIGVQSFHQPHLKVLGRIHNPEEAVNAANYARAAGFDNFNLDLMFGLPDQSTDQAIADVEQALSLNPTHLSCYQLTIEPNTLFHHQPPVTPDDDALWEIQTALQDILRRHEYRQYEVSAYAQADQQCRHNLNYWQFGDYLGIGAGAHGKLSQDGKVIRSWKIKHPATYMDKDSKVGGEDAVETQQLPFEFMMNALRLNGGFSIEQFEARCGLPVTTIEPLLEKHQQQKLISINAEQVRPTPFGHSMLNNMLEDYLALSF